MSYIGNKNSVALYDAFTKEQSEANYAPITRSRKNLLINGGFDIWQRGTSFTLPEGNTYGPDRFATGHTAGEVSLSKVEGPTKGTSAARCEVTTSFDVGTNGFLLLYTRLEQGDVSRTVFGQGNIAVSFLVTSNLTGTYTANLTAHNTNTGLADTRLVVGKEFTITTANEPQKVTLIFSKNEVYNWINGVDHTSAGLSLSIVLDVGTNRVSLTEGQWMDPSIETRNGTMVSNSQKFANTIGNYIEITEMQLEEGDTATDFEQRPIGEELALCQRYYFQINGTLFLNPTNGEVNLNRRRNFYIYPVSMRSIPSIVATISASSGSGTISTSPYIEGVYLNGSADSIYSDFYLSFLSGDAEL